MKKITLMILMILSLATTAALIPQENLLKAANFIQKLAADDGQQVIVKITDGELDKNGQVQKLNIKVNNGEDNDLENLDISAGFEIKDEKIKVTLGLSGEHQDLKQKMMVQQVLMMANMVIMKINNQGDYKADLNVTNESGIVLADLSLKPVSDEAVSLSSLNLSVLVDTNKGSLKVEIDGLFNPKSDLVNKAKQAFTKVLNRLMKEEMPTSEEQEELSTVMQEIADSLQLSI